MNTSSSELDRHYSSFTTKVGWKSKWLQTLDFAFVKDEELKMSGKSINKKEHWIGS